MWLGYLVCSLGKCTIKLCIETDLIFLIYGRVNDAADCNVSELILISCSLVCATNITVHWCLSNMCVYIHI